MIPAIGSLARSGMHNAARPTGCSGAADSVH